MIVAGEHNQVVDEGTEQTVNVARLTVHEHYQDGKAFENDIAIWSLAEPLVLNEYVSGNLLRILFIKIPAYNITQLDLLYVMLSLWGGLIFIKLM